MFTLSTHPAALTVGQGISDAFNYLLKTWRYWLPLVLIVAAADFLSGVVTGSPNIQDYRTTTTFNGQTVDTYDFARYSSAVARGAIFTIPAGAIAGWVYTATAIAGLRGRPLTLESVVIRGLLSIVSGILVALLFIGLIIVTAIVFFVVVAILANINGGLGALVAIVGIIVWICALIYLGIRLLFTTLSVFDGSDPIEGIRESWRLSRGSVLRMFGWGLLWVAISFFAFGIVGLIFSGAFSSSAPAIGAGASGFITAIGACFGTYYLATLYESQRARIGPPGAQFAGGYPGYPGGPGYPPGYQQPGYPPPGYQQPGYQQQGYPAPGYPPDAQGQYGYPPSPGGTQGNWPPPASPQTQGNWPPPPPSGQPGSWTPPPSGQPGSWTPPPSGQPGSWTPPPQGSGSWPPAPPAPPPGQSGAWPPSPGSWPPPAPSFPPPPQPPTDSQAPGGETPTTSQPSLPNQPAPDQPAPDQPAPDQPAPGQPGPNQPSPNEPPPGTE